MPYEAAFLIGFKWPIESSEAPEDTVESIPRKQRCAHASLQPQRLPVRASPRCRA